MKKQWSILMGLAGLQTLLVSTHVLANCETASEIDLLLNKYESQADQSLGYWGADAALNQLKQECPQLPWKSIRYVGDEISKHDWAISAGTSDKSYAFYSYLTSNKAAAIASLQCTESVDLTKCVEQLTCEQVGRYSMFCGNYPL